MKSIMKLFRQFVLIMAIVAFLYTIQCAVAYEHEKFSYKSGAWNGPEHWGDINKDWETCKTGHSQSPVAIDDKKIELVNQIEDLQLNYHPEKAVMKNLGHHIVIEWEAPVGAVWINKTEYSLTQLHWHIPSENIINGHQFDLEVHLLHQHTTDQTMAMLSILFKVGDPDPFFTKVEKHIPTIRKKIGAKVDIGIIDPKKVSRTIKKYFRLMGSTTTPPCTEGVIWTINKEIRTVSPRQLNLLKDALEADYATNARPVQPLNDRVVQLFV